MFDRLRIICVTLLLQLIFNNLTVNGQLGLKLSAGVSDIAFLEEGQEIFLGYETNYLIHNLPSFSFQSGALLQLKTSGRFIPRAEVLISREGLNYTSHFLYDDIRYLIRITYLKVPLLIKIDPNLKNERQSGFILGPYFSYKIKSTLFTKIQGTNKKEDKENVKNYDFGLTAGYNWDIGRSPGHLFLDVRSGYGLINMMNLLEPAVADYPELPKEYARNVNILVAIEYLF
jgi:hypothetical protein